MKRCFPKEEALQGERFIYDLEKRAEEYVPCDSLELRFLWNYQNILVVLFHLTMATGMILLGSEIYRERVMMFIGRFPKKISIVHFIFYFFQFSKNIYIRSASKYFHFFLV